MAAKNSPVSQLKRSSASNESVVQNVSPDPAERAFHLRFEVLDPLGAGSFGEVFNGFDRSAKLFVAIKIERTLSGKRGSLEKEAIRYQMLEERLKVELPHLPPNAGLGVPKIFDFCKAENRSYLVMEKMGPSLESLYQKCNRRFSLKTVCQIAVQMIDRIQAIHAAQMIHRDVKPDNFVIGCAGDARVSRNFIRVIDFGLSRDYVQNGRHIPEAANRDLVGTVRYVSVRVHDGVEQSRRDDIESIGHVLIYFLKPLPWMGIAAPDKLPERQKTKIRYKLVGEKKKEVGIESLCSGLPPQFQRFMEYARNEMSFREKPDYDFLRSLFKKLMKKSGFARDNHYDWDDRSEDEHENAADLSSTNKAVRGPGTPKS